MNTYDFVGIDIAKDKFDVALTKGGKTFDKVFANNLSGIKACYKWVTKHTQCPWVSMEATGHYSTQLADYLHVKGVKVSVINPLKIKHYAKAIFMRNKNDVLDARVIAQFTQATKPHDYQPKSPAQAELNDLIKILDTLKKNVLTLKNQLESTQSSSVRASIKKLIARLEKDIKQLEEEIAKLISKNPELNQKMALITSIKGVGKQTAYKVLARAFDIHRFAHAKQFAAFIGVSPRQNQSGKFIGKTRMSCLGDASLRKVLYMAALVTKRHNPAIQAFVKRLQDKGKAPKAIIGAIMRKLAHWIFGVLKHNKPFEAHYA